MVWDHLSITKPHLVYIILGGFTSLFMLCSSFIKERLYIGEATVATICGIIFGPHAANLIDPASWGGNVDLITIEFSRIVLVVQCFAVGVELPKFYMEKHWKSVFLLLVPVMIWGWLIVSLVIWWIIPGLNWLDGLLVAACITATDPVLASSVVGKGKFAKRVPKHLRDLLSAESGCNDGMAFPFIYLAIYLIVDHMKAKEVTFHWIVYTILYECIFGCIFGFTIGYIARHGIKQAEKRDLIDRESFLVFYFVLALFCAGAGSMLGMDDLLIGFAAGVGFSNDGWFSDKTEESHVSNVIDLLLNLAYFVYLGTIIPWEQFNNVELGLDAWRLVVIAIFVLLFRRIPIMLILKPIIPDVKTWREALFAGHFGPVGVGAIFVAILARSELIYESTVPQTDMDEEHLGTYPVIPYIWPIVTFIVIASIIVHGSSIAVFTLGKRINTLTLTMSYTTAAPGDGPSWMERLPRISSVSRSQARTMSDTSYDDLKEPGMPPGVFLRRQREEEGKTSSRASSLVPRRRRKKWDDGIGPGGPISKSAYGPRHRASKDPEKTDEVAPVTSPTYERDPEKIAIESSSEGPSRAQTPPRLEVYDEGDHIIVENQDGEVLAVEPVRDQPTVTGPADPSDVEAQAPKQDKFDWSVGAFRRKLSEAWDSEIQKRREKDKDTRRHEPARAFQFGNTVIVEDEDGEVIKTYQLPSDKPEGTDLVSQSLKYMGMGGLAKDKAPEGAEAEASKTAMRAWPGFGLLGVGDGAERARRKSVAQEEAAADDRHIRFTIDGVGQRLTKEDFIRRMQQLDAEERQEVVNTSSASHVVKTLARQDPQRNMSTAVDPFTKPAAQHRAEEAEEDEDRRPRRGRSSESLSPTRKPGEPSSGAPARSEPETAVERRRRLAVLAAQADADDEAEAGETPAERRRREAALGMAGGGADEDSDEDEGDRVPPTRRGIRFADTPERGRK